MPGWLRGVLWAVVAISVLSTTSYLTGLDSLTSSNTSQTALRLALPILFAALGGLGRNARVSSTSGSRA